MIMRSRSRSRSQSLKVFLFFFTITCTTTTTNAQMVRNCFCDEADSCTQRYLTFMIPCADRCQNRAVAGLGANYNMLRRCLVSIEPSVRDAVNCVWHSMPNSCVNEQPRMIQRHYNTGLKFAIMTELNSISQRSGIELQEIAGLISGGKKLLTCIQKCMDKSSGGCMSAKDCQLVMPPDNVFVQMIKRCAIQNGFDTNSFRQFCQCVTQSGVTQLGSICWRIQIS